MCRFVPNGFELSCPAEADRPAGQAPHPIRQPRVSFSELSGRIFAWRSRSEWASPDRCPDDKSGRHQD
ncbi:MAG: hypothetical protein WBF31_02845, partial [Anaerolineae bacterium]